MGKGGQHDGARGTHWWTCCPSSGPQPGSMLLHEKRPAGGAGHLAPVRHPVHHGGPQPHVLLLRRSGPLRLHRHGHRCPLRLLRAHLGGRALRPGLCPAFQLCAPPQSGLASDTVIGVFSSTAVALGIFMSTLGGRSFTKFNSLLIGDILVGGARQDRPAGPDPGCWSWPCGCCPSTS